MTTDAYNPRYVVYARMRGFQDVEKCIEADKELYPGACMMEFILWNTAQWDEFHAKWNKEHPFNRYRRWDISGFCQKEFDAWLQEKYV